MANMQDAILAIRSAVQDLAGPEWKLGGRAPRDQVQWLGKLLGFQWPRAYMDLLLRHDGVRVRQAHLLSFFDAFRLFIVHRDPWHTLQFWPVAEDGCGDYWVLPLREQKDGDCPVYWLDHETDAGMAAPTKIAAASLPDFIVDYMKSLWARASDEDDGAIDEDP